MRLHRTQGRARGVINIAGIAKPRLQSKASQPATDEVITAVTAPSKRWSDIAALFCHTIVSGQGPTGSCRLVFKSTIRGPSAFPTPIVVYDSLLTRTQTYVNICSVFSRLNYKTGQLYGLVIDMGRNSCVKRRTYGHANSNHSLLKIN